MFFLSWNVQRKYAFITIFQQPMMQGRPMGPQGPQGMPRFPNQNQWNPRQNGPRPMPNGPPGNGPPQRPMVNIAGASYRRNKRSHTFQAEYVTNFFYI